jgi:uncharacterized protein YndB with AHSA1/START domain
MRRVRAWTGEPVFAIAHDLAIRAGSARVFDVVSTPRGLDAWWTKRCAGTAMLHGDLDLDFGGDVIWRAEVVDYAPARRLSLRMTTASEDWVGTRLEFTLSATQEGTSLSFLHTGWAEQSAHFRQSSYCWAMYLRLMRIHCETGAVTPYADRYRA